MRFEDFQDGHLRYRNRMILAIRNLYVARFGRRCFLKNFKMAAVAAILDVGMEQI